MIPVAALMRCCPFVHSARLVSLLTIIMVTHFVLPIDGHAEPNFARIPAPAWVRVSTPVQPTQVPIADIQDGAYILYSGTQIMVAEGQPFQYHRHYSEYIINETGLNKASQINIDFDPSYQALALNTLHVRRNGKIISKLHDAQFQLLRREKRLESMLYDGRYTLTCILDDIRVGDVIETAYTITGDNPIFGGLFSYFLPVAWRLPIEKVDFILHWPKDKILIQRGYNTPLALTRQDAGDHLVYTLSLHQSKSYRANSQIPSWHRAYGVIQLSEINHWEDVIAWALPLYRVAYKPDNKVASLAKEIQRKHITKADCLMGTLQYIQKEIRYLGIEAGVNSHRPSPPRETLSRRFGDCKDKSVAMVALLTAMGIDAQPVLVNTDKIKDPERYLPTPQAFDHVIVRATLKGRHYWLDPTRKYQNGDLEQVYQPNYGYALVIGSGESNLVEMPSNTHLVGTRIIEEFDLTTENNEDVAYTVTTLYKGLDAEYMRRQIAGEGVGELQKQYLDFYRKYYPNIRVDTPMVVNCLTDCSDLNTVEQYRIGQFWQLDKSSQSWVADFYTNALYSYLKRPEQQQRRDPFAISHPVDVEQQINGRLLKTMSVDEFSFSEENPFFIFHADASLDRFKSTMRLTYRFRSLTDSIPAAKIKEYLAAIDRVERNLDYRIVNPELYVAEGKGGWFFANLWWLFIVAVGLMVAYIFLEWGLDIRKSQPDSTAVYYPVSYMKFVILSVSTFGLYLYFWFYMQWRYIRDRDLSCISPFFRSMWMPFWYYPLFNDLQKDSRKRFGNSRLPVAPVMILLLLIFIGLNIMGRAENAIGFAGILSFLCLVPFVNYIAYINRDNEEAIAQNSRFRPRHYLLATLMSLFLTYSILVTIHWMPSPDVIRGKDLPSWTIRFMQRQGLVQFADDLIYFYCDAFWSNKDDGNGVTRNTVFSYWRDPDTGQIITRSAKYEDISHIRVNNGSSSSDNMTISIVPSSGSEFYIYISKENRMNQKVVEEIRTRMASQGGGDLHQP